MTSDSVELGMYPAATGSASARLFTPLATAASCLAFVVIGALQALYGPAIPALRDKFGISPAAAGLSLSAHFVGALVGVLLVARLHRQWSNRRVLSASYALMAAGAAGFALAPTWSLSLVAALLLGLGFGGIDYGLNVLFAEGFGHRSTAMLNILNAHFGVGAVIGPLVIGWLPPGEYGLAFLGCAALSAFLLLTMKGVGERAARPPAEPDAAAPATPAVLLLAAFVLVYVLHVAIETGVGGWEPTHLQALGHTAAAAATATSVFWLMLTVGRFAVAPISLRWPPSVIVTWSCVAMAAFLGLATVPALAPYAYAWGRPRNRTDLPDRVGLAESSSSKCHQGWGLRHRRVDDRGCRVSPTARRGDRLGRGVPPPPRAPVAGRHLRRRLLVAHRADTRPR